MKRSSAESAKARLQRDQINQRILQTVIPPDEATRIGGVLITGSASSVGVPLVMALSTRGMTEKIVAIDTQYPLPFAPAMIFHRRNPSRALDDIFALHRPEVAIHLGTAQAASQDGGRESFEGMLSYKAFFAACHQIPPRCVVLLSGASVYGAWPDNPAALAEDAPLRPRAESSAAAGYMLAERAAAEYASEYPDVRVIVVRSAPSLGPNADHALARALRHPTLLTLPGCNPPLQFVDEQDLVNALLALAASERSGVYNVAADDPISLAQTLQITGVRAQSLPPSVLSPAVNLAQWLNIANLSTLDVAQISELCYPLLLDTSKLKADLGFSYRYTCEQTLHEFAGKATMRNP